MESGMTGTVKFRADAAKQKNEACKKECLWQDLTTKGKKRKMARAIAFFRHLLQT